MAVEQPAYTLQIDDGAFELRAQPLVGVEDDAVGTFDPGPERAELRADHRAAGPGGVDMAVKPVGAADGQRVGNPVEGADRGAARA